MIDTNTSIRPACGQRGTQMTVMAGQEALQFFSQQRSELMSNLMRGIQRPQKLPLWLVADESTDLAPLVAAVRNYDEVDVVAKSLPSDLPYGTIHPVQPRVVVVSISESSEAGLALIRRVKDMGVAFQVVAILPKDEPDFVFKAMLAGASGYVIRGSDVGGLVEALVEVHCGGSVLNSFTSGKVVQYFQARPSTTAESKKPSSLSTREHQVLDFLSTGSAYKEIATELRISVETVRRHCHNLYEKLGVSSKAEAVALRGQLV
jgi:DNA-binding NarL/FixJ family response regulator